MPDTHSLSTRTARPAADRLRHGGDLAEVAAAPGAFTGSWLDLSTGISPWPYPAGKVPEPLWTRLPGRAIEERLHCTAAGYYGAPGPENVVAAPGSQALIQWLPRLRAPGRIAVRVPTYNEHAMAWESAGHQVVETKELPATDEGWDVVVVTNPNNPDGRRHEPARLMALRDALARRGGWLVLDEAFADVAPELSLADRVAQPGLVILRSFGKFFGLAGLRLGFALAGTALTAPLRQAFGPWAVSGPAAWIAASAFEDRDWIAATRVRLAEAAARLDALLAASGLEILGGTSLYRLATTPRAAAVVTCLRKAGIHIRDFTEQPRWLRFGLPPDAEGFERLRHALSSAICA